MSDPNSSAPRAAAGDEIGAAVELLRNSIGWPLYKREEVALDRLASLARRAEVDVDKIASLISLHAVIERQHDSVGHAHDRISNTREVAEHIAAALKSATPAAAEGKV